MLEEMDIELGDLGSQVAMVEWQVDPRDDHDVRLVSVKVWFGGNETEVINDLTKAAKAYFIEKIKNERNE